MHRRAPKRHKDAGLPPGSLIHVGERRTDAVRITITDYSETTLEERAVSRIEECLPFKDTASVTWINVDGLHDVEIVATLGSLFEIHSLTLEDVLNTNQRPKYENLGHHLFLVARMINQRTDGGIAAEQVSLVLGSNFVVTFQEAPGDVFGPVRDRIRSGTGRIRKMGPDYLAYALLDAIVDGYFPVLESLGDDIERTEDTLVTDPRIETLRALYRLRSEMILLRRSVWPLREVMSGLEREDSPLIQEATQRFFRDVYDHVIHVVDTIDSYRELVSGMLDTYLSSVSNRMNEVMKVLTIIATIFIPLTFIAGVYGMNFAHMPELGWRWAYPAVWGVMAGIAVFMVAYFRRRRWL
ncbi:magnesium/cobalt transporter CorA [Candidatus Fermentibacteria bacterium]|nr:magnesium/cobalt transporter CorA [Candidatus Fermentibacteria bacterium]